MQVAAYVIVTKDVDLRLERGFGLNLSVNADADFTAASKNRMSMSGISWKCSTQKCVTIATCEAVYHTSRDASNFMRDVLIFQRPEPTGVIKYCR